MKRTPLARAAPIAAISDRRRRRDAGYPSSRRAIYERADGMCEAATGDRCEFDGYQVHHVAGRGGPDPHRLANLLLCCRSCHEYIHANPTEATAAGWMATRHRSDT